MFDITWCQPPREMVLARGHVDLWCGKLRPFDVELEQLWGAVSADEQKCARRFHFDRDRNLFIKARGLLRSVLAYYVDELPQSLRFKCNMYGKQLLVGGDKRLRFDMSYSADIFLLAVACERDVGVHVELQEPIPEMADVTRRFFSEREQAIWNCLPQQQRAQAFYNCWVAKTAFIKAQGRDVPLRMDQFDVLKGGELGDIRWELEEAAAWQLKRVDTLPSYASTIAVRGRGWQLNHWHCTPEQLLSRVVSGG